MDDSDQYMEDYQNDYDYNNDNNEEDLIQNNYQNYNNGNKFIQTGNKKIPMIK